MRALLQSDNPSTLCIPASMHESPGATGVHRIGEADEPASRGDRGECLNPRPPNRAHGAGRISDATPTKNGDCPSTLRRMRSRGPVTASRAAEGGRGGSPRAHARTDYERHG